MSIRDRMKQDVVAVGGRTKGGPHGISVDTSVVYGHTDLQGWIILRAFNSPADAISRDGKNYVFIPRDRRDKLILFALRAGDLEAARRWISSWPRRICEHCNGELVGTERREPYLDGCDDVVRIKRTGHYDWWHANSGRWMNSECNPPPCVATPSAHERDPLVSA